MSEDQREPYRLARVEAVPDLLTDEERGPLSTMRERLARLLDTVLPLGVEPPDPGLDDAEFVNLIAQALSMPEDAAGPARAQQRALRARALVDRLEQR